MQAALRSAGCFEIEAMPTSASEDERLEKELFDDEEEVDLGDALGRLGAG